MQTRVILLLALSLIGCVPSLQVVKKESTLKVPNEFPNDSSQTESTATQSWKEFFSDPSLNALIETSLQNNQELQVLGQEINVANNEVMARGGEILPKLGLGAGYSLDKVGKYTPLGASEGANGLPDPLQMPSIGLFTNWEIDIWKKLRNATQASYFNYLASIETRKFFVTQLVSEIAHTYFELLALDKQLEIIDSYVEVLQKIKSMTGLQQVAGRSTSLPVVRFEAEVLKNQSRRAQLQQQIVTAENGLNALAGRFPQELKRDASAFLEIQLSPISTGVPTSLLDNRPDIKAAAFELEATKLSVKSVKANFFPALRIDAGVGFQSFNWSHFVSIPESLFYGVAGNLVAPLLNRQAIKAAYFSANNKQIQAVYHYEQTLITAYTEVSNKLSMIKNLTNAYDLKSKQVGTLNNAIKISNTLFMAARVDYVEALLTQRDSLEAQIELIETKKELLSAHIGLYKALGGGWRSQQESNL